MIDKGSLWFIIFALGIGSFMLRVSFLGVVGDRPLPARMLARQDKEEALKERSTTTSTDGNDDAAAGGRGRA